MGADKDDEQIKLKRKKAREEAKTVPHVCEFISLAPFQSHASKNLNIKPTLQILKSFKPGSKLLSQQGDMAFYTDIQQRRRERLRWHPQVNKSPAVLWRRKG